MKEIGTKLKEKREENGVSVEEVAEDLKMRPSQIISIEEGKKEDFKDVMTLKYFIRDYAKYLGLDGEKLVDEFNEFLFDYTSKIPVADIEKAKKNRKNNKDFISPYTSSKKNNKLKIITIFIIIALVVAIVGYTLYIDKTKGNDFKDDNITYVIRR